jgi:hypothetical protein
MQQPQDGNCEDLVAHWHILVEFHDDVTLHISGVVTSMHAQITPNVLVLMHRFSQLHQRHTSSKELGGASGSLSSSLTRCFS